MLIHKTTLGVLDYYWTGRYAKGPDDQQLPLMAEYTLEGTGLGADEWWYVPSRSPLASRIRWSYPWMDPVIGEEGELLDIHPWPRWKREGEAPPEEPPKPKKSRQHRRRGGLFESLLTSDAGKECNMNNPSIWKRGGRLPLRTRHIVQMLANAIQRGWAR